MASILIVDDEPAIRSLIREIFEEAGHLVTEAANGAMALLRIGERVPDLLVTDVMMPVMDGAALIAHLRADPAMAGIPILAVTGDPRRAGAADATLVKPFSPAELAALANSLLDIRL